LDATDFERIEAHVATLKDLKSRVEELEFLFVLKNS
jgi:hypothetical protein